MLTLAATGWEDSSCNCPAVEGCSVKGEDAGALSPVGAGWTGCLLKLVDSIVIWVWFDSKIRVVGSSGGELGVVSGCTAGFVIWVAFKELPNADADESKEILNII